LVKFRFPSFMELVINKIVYFFSVVIGQASVSLQVEAGSRLSLVQIVQ